MGRIYTFYMKKIFRTKTVLFWGLAFPLILGSLFFFAFSSIYSQQSSKAMKVAIVGENAKDHPFVKVLEELTYDNGSKMMDITFTNEEEAFRLLELGAPNSSAKGLNGQSLDKENDDETKKVIGVITLNSETDVTLKIAANDMYQSILSGIVSAYRAKAEFIQDAAAKGQEAMMQAAESVKKDIEYTENSGMAGENKDPYVAYFYNLLAMMCILGSTTMLDMIVSLQPNTSDTGLRVGASGVSKLKFEAGVILAVLTFQSMSMGIALVYLLGILGINFGGEVPMVILTSFLGVLLGISLGFFVAHIGRFKYGVKNTILTLLTLGGGALSGLYAVQLKAVVEENAPIINRINPMSVITDAYYSLNIFGVGERFYKGVLIMLGLTAGLFLLGGLLSRRNQYESL